MAESAPFVGRTLELARLSDWLDNALAGRGQVAFITGEAGSGKSTLVTEFCRRAQEQHTHLIVAAGQCDAQIGAGDPFLPFREILALLTGDVETRLAQGRLTSEHAGRLRRFLKVSGQALVEFGPDLVEAVIPGAGLVSRVGKYVAEKLGWTEKLTQLSRAPAVPGATGIEPNQILEQYANVLSELAKHQPLVLVVDDLQWADEASINLLSRLARRIVTSRILLIGTYRPDDVAVGRSGSRHPLEQALNIVRRYAGDVQIDLDQARQVDGRQFVESLIDSEPNLFDRGFRTALYEHTNGHPLFVAEMLSNLQERGDLARDAQDRWIVARAIDWSQLPARVEGVIAERIDRLAIELRETLTIASVEGEAFTAEVVARVQRSDERNLVRRLSAELDRQHRLVRNEGLERIGGQRLSRYQFRHNLFQTYLYLQLDPAERAYLHEDVGTALEALYGGEAETIAVQLARHFREANVPDKARHYLFAAGCQAAARYANEAAITSFTEALALTREDMCDEQIELLLAREQILDVQGAREPQRADLERLHELVGADGKIIQRARVALRRANFALAHEVRFTQACELAQQAAHLAEEAGDQALVASAYQQWGLALLNGSDFVSARQQLARALTLARAHTLPAVEAATLYSLGIIAQIQGDHLAARECFECAIDRYTAVGNRRGEAMARNNLGHYETGRGNFAAADTAFSTALAIAQSIGDRRGEQRMHNNRGMIALFTGAYQSADEHLKVALAVAEQIGDRIGRNKVFTNLGILARLRGELPQATSLLLKDLDDAQALGDRRAAGILLAQLSLVAGTAGDQTAAFGYAAEAQSLHAAMGNQPEQAQALAALGHALTALGRPDEAERAYAECLALRSALGQPHLAVEAHAGFARLSIKCGDTAAAMDHVVPILERLEAGALLGLDEPLRPELTCYEVLTATGDERARVVLRLAATRLRELLATTATLEQRRAMLEQVPQHRALAQAWRKAQAEGKASSSDTHR